MGLMGQADNSPLWIESISDKEVTSSSHRNIIITDRDEEIFEFSELEKSGINHSTVIVENTVELPVIEIECKITMKTLKYIIATMINTEDEIFKHRIIDNLVSYIVHGNLLSNIDRIWNTMEGQLVGDLLKKLIMTFDKTKDNMAILSGCLVCVFRKIVERTSIPADETSAKLLVFIDIVSKYVHEFDNAMWNQWFSNDTITVDWFHFMAGVFIPKGNLFTGKDRRVIENAMKYLGKIKYCLYTCAFEKKTFKISKANVRNCTLMIKKKSHDD